MATRGKTDLPVDQSTQKAAATAHAAINVPLNVECWTALPDEIADQLIWFHQHVIDRKLSWKDVQDLLGYDNTVIFRVLKGTYQGSYENVVARITDYRTRLATIQRSGFAENRISRLIGSTCEYVVTCSGMGLIMGESGQGKSCSAREWQHRHNGGRTAMVEVPPTGGHRGFLAAFASKQGSNKSASLAAQEAYTLRAFNARRVLLVDEAHRLIPADRRTPPRSLEFLRYLHDRTGVPIVLLATQRFNAELRANQYMFEQVLGRIDIPVTLPQKMDARDYGPLISQYVPEPSPKLMRLCEEVANSWDGRMRALDKLCVFASRIASKAGQPLAEQHVFQALAWRAKLAKGDL